VTFTRADAGRTAARSICPSGAHVFSRQGEPFTPAERARAHRLAQLAETIELGRRTVVPRTE
jgi:hypothetical protein